MTIKDFEKAYQIYNNIKDLEYDIKTLMEITDKSDSINFRTDYSDHEITMSKDEITQMIINKQKRLDGLKKYFESI